MSLITELLPAFDSVTLGSITTAKPGINKRTFHGLLLQVLGASAYDTGGAAGTLDFRHVAEHVEIFKSGRSKCLIKPEHWRCYADFFNSNDDTLPADFLYLPLSRPGVAESDWATGDMESLHISAKLAAALPTGTGANASFMCVDELWRFVDAHSLPAELEKEARMGRAEGLELLIATHHPRDYHRDLRAEVTEWVCFNTIEPGDLDAVRPYFRGVDRVASLPRGSFLAYNRESGAELAGTVF